MKAKLLLYLQSFLLILNNTIHTDKNILWKNLWKNDTSILIEMMLYISVSVEQINPSL